MFYKVSSLLGITLKYNKYPVDNSLDVFVAFDDDDMMIMMELIICLLTNKYTTLSMCQTVSLVFLCLSSSSVHSNPNKQVLSLSPF